MSRRVVFMGTPAFAVASLRALVDAGVEVAAVITAPDRPAGRGQRIQMSAVKEYALANNALKDRILQPVKLKDPDFHRQLDAADASLYIVVAFRMLPELVWTRPTLGTINLHASLLPDYRGAAPINWAIINGERETGVTTFFIRHEIDQGDVIARERTAIGPEETAGELHDRLMIMGAELLVQSTREILAGQARREPQVPPAGIALHHAPKLVPENCRIDVRTEARRVHDHVRGLSPFPGAWAIWQEPDRAGQHFKVLRTRVVTGEPAAEPGTITIVQDRLFLQCATAQVELLEVQAEGKRRMDAASFIRGLRHTDHIRLT